ncbi:MAG: hypothetical protein MJ096_06725 [Clostridia bacterium]|nr:hypothetical protein [Clostridia bacterium]
MKKVISLIILVLLAVTLVSCAARPENAFVVGYPQKTFDAAVRDRYANFDGDVSFDWSEDWEAEGAPDLRRLDPGSDPVRFTIEVGGEEDETSTMIVIFFSFDTASNELVARGVWMRDGRTSKSFDGGYADKLYEDIYGEKD